MNAALASAGGRNGSPEDIAAVRTGLRAWVGIQKGADVRLVEAWLDQLRDGGLFWQACGESLPRLLSERFAAVAELARRWDATPSAKVAPALQAWLGHARHIRESWSPPDPIAWHCLLVELPQRGNLLANGIVAHALAAAWQLALVPKALTALLAPLLQPAMAWCKTSPLPPSSKCSLEPAQYVLLHPESAACESLEQAVAHIRQRLDTARLVTAAAIPATGDRRIVGLLEEVVREVVARRREWMDALAAGCHGWPTEVSILRERGTAFFAALDKLQRISHPMIEAVKTDVAACAIPLRQDWKQLLERSVSRNIQDSSVNLVESSALPASGVPAAEISWRDRLAGLADRVGDAADVSSERFATRLLELAAAWERAEQTGGPEALQPVWRQVVGCLVYLDQRASEPRPPAWVAMSREMLRSMLTSDSHYCVIDSELVGGSLTQYESQVEAVGLVESRTVRSGFIASVEAPGYIVKVGDGAWRVLQKARVRMAK